MNHSSSHLPGHTDYIRRQIHCLLLQWRNWTQKFERSLTPRKTGGAIWLLTVKRDYACVNKTSRCEIQITAEIKPSDHCIKAYDHQNWEVNHTQLTVQYSCQIRRKREKYARKLQTPCRSRKTFNIPSGDIRGRTQFQRLLIFLPVFYYTALFLLD